MKRLGITLLMMAAFGLVGMFFKLDDTWWETLFGLLVMASFATVPQFDQLLAWKLHWRIALMIAIICTFAIVWQLLDRFMRDYQEYSFTATLIVFSLSSFLLHFLDARNSRGAKVNHEQTGHRH